jgi:hypothetical protein
LVIAIRPHGPAVGGKVRQSLTFEQRPVLALLQAPIGAIGEIHGRVTDIGKTNTDHSLGFPGAGLPSHHTGAPAGEPENDNVLEDPEDCGSLRRHGNQHVRLRQALVSSDLASETGGLEPPFSFLGLAIR